MLTVYTSTPEGTLRRTEPTDLREASGTIWIDLVEPRSTLSLWPALPLFAHQRVEVDESTAFAALFPLPVSSLLAVAVLPAATSAGCTDRSSVTPTTLSSG